MTHEERARAAAHSCPPCDLGSTRGIQIIADAIRAACEEARAGERERAGYEATGELVARQGLVVDLTLALAVGDAIRSRGGEPREGEGK